MGDDRKAEKVLPSIMLDPSLESEEDVLPSIMLDPSLESEIGRRRSNHPTLIGASVSGAPGSPDPATTEARLDSAPPTIGALSADEADAFAQSIRASWDPPAPSPSATPSTPSIARASKAARPTSQAPSAPDSSTTQAEVADAPSKSTIYSKAFWPALASVMLVFGLFLWHDDGGAPPVPDPTEQGFQRSEAAPTTSTAQEPTSPLDTSALAEPEPAPEQPTEQPSATVPAEPSATDPMPGESDATDTRPTEAPAAQEARLDVRVSPADAKLRLDGTAMPNPFTVAVKRGGIHRLEAAADGHLPRTWKLTMEADRRLRASLRRSRRHSERPRPSPTRQGARKPPAAQEPAEPPPKPDPPPGSGFVTNNPY